MLLDVAGEQDDIVHTDVSQAIQRLLHVLTQPVLNTDHAEQSLFRRNIDDALPAAHHAMDCIGSQESRSISCSVMNRRLPTRINRPSTRVSTPRAVKTFVSV